MINMFEVMDSKDRNIYSLDEMIDMYDDDEVNYSYVHKRLCCPCCNRRNIQIKFTDQTASIKSKRSSHDITCDYYGYTESQVNIKKKLKAGTSFEEDMLEVQNKINTKLKRVPKKSIERLLCDDDYNIYKIFYGNVIIKKAYSKDETKYLNYSLKSKRGDIIIVSIQRHLFVHMQSTLLFLEKNIDHEINIVFLGVLKEVERYNNLELEHSSLLMVKEI